MKRLFSRFIRVLAFALLLGAVRPALAVYPAPWPDNGNPDVNFKWRAYTQLGTAIGDKPSASDNSTGGTTPTQAADFITGGLPSFYTGFDSVNQVLFVRMRLASSPLTPTPNGASNDDPFGNVTWSLLIDIDGDGFKEFLVRLNGDIGGPTNPIDDLAVYYDNTRSQALPAGATPIWVIDAMDPNAVPVDADARADVYDFRFTRGFDSTTLPSVGYFLDFQIPLSSFTVGGTQLITQSTPVAFGFGTSNSNTNPFQKDAGYDGTFTATTGDPFPFGDPGTPGGGVNPNPIVTSLTTTGACGTETLDATVMDTLVVSGGVVVSTVSNVQFFFQPDFDNNGVPDNGTTSTPIGTDNTPDPADPTHWSVAWNNTGVANGHYVIFAIATDQQNHSGTSAYVGFLQACGGVAVSGTVYSDANHNAVKDGAETGTGVASLFVKLVLNGSTSASAAAAVDPTTGAYAFSGISAGTYSLVLDNNNTLSDITPSRPANYIGTQNPTQQISGIVVTAASVSGQNFGLFNGSKATGVVFRDNGSGGGVANNGIQSGTETGLAGISVSLTNSAGSATYDTATTDGAGAFTVWVVAANAAQTLRIVETNGASTLSTGASIGTTAGTYNRATDAISFSGAAGVAYSDVQFGDVPGNTFTNDGAQSGAAGTTVYYPHVFTAGSGGSVVFSTTNLATPANPNWSRQIYRDLNANGVLDAGEPLITGAITVVAGDVVAILVAENIPAGAALGNQDTVTVTETFTYTGATPALSAAIAHQDVTTVGTPGEALQLIKSVDKASAAPGELVTYTITYRNLTALPLSNLVVSDNTPPFTNFAAASTGALPASLTGVTITAPAVGATGTVTWTFTGTLAPNSSGTITLQVNVQ